jgi:hypothetical protein
MDEMDKYNRKLTYDQNDFCHADKLANPEFRFHTEMSGI